MACEFRVFLTYLLSKLDFLIDGKGGDRFQNNANPASRIQVKREPDFEFGIRDTRACLTSAKQADSVLASFCYCNFHGESHYGGDVTLPWGSSWDLPALWLDENSWFENFNAIFLIVPLGFAENSGASE